MELDFTKVATLSGKVGLFRVVKPTRTGVVLESLNENKKRIMASASSKVSILGEISMYVLNEEGSKPLPEIMQDIYTKQEGQKVSLDKKSSEAELWQFMDEHLPDFDEDKVYPSDIVKLVSWYNILVDHAPSLFEAKEADGKEDDSETEEIPDSSNEEE